MPLLEHACLIARGAAFEVPRYFSERAWKRQFMKQLESRNIAAVLNVGANPGQYAASFRKAANKGCIISLEPLPGPFPVLESKASTDPLRDCQQCALGDGDGTISINVAGNVGQRSSVLSMLKSHKDFYAAANYIGPEEVPIHRLDSAAPAILRSAYATLLEIGMLIREAPDLAYSLGFALTASLPCFTDLRNGRMLQADGVFFREDD